MEFAKYSPAPAEVTAELKKKYADRVQVTDDE
jgi:hypothetical protein